MNNKYLTIYDLSGIQNFIFSTPKLQDMIGASSIVHTALFANIPEMLGKPNWARESILSKQNNGEFRGDLVYIGGGNALLMFDCCQDEKIFTRELCKRVYEQSGGSIRLCSASVLLDETKTLAENQKVLMAKLDDNKRAAGNMHPFVGLSVTAQDSNHYEPIVFYETGCDTKGGHCKKKEYERLKNIKNSDDGVAFWQAVEFEQFRGNGKNYLAIIHIDGNTMGVMIREFVQKLNDPILESMEKFKQLSLSISSLYKDVLTETMQELYAGCQDEIPFRTIVADGDDITVIIESKNAFSFVKTFMQNLTQKGHQYFKNFTPTAAAGVAFVKLKFPFYTAYNIAEACCKNAKKVTLERYGIAKNSMDFQVCYSGLTSNISRFRANNYTKLYRGQQYRLAKRPYIFEDGDPYSFDVLENITKEMIVSADQSMARNKLKALRNAYGEGVLAARTYGKFIKEHRMPGYEKIADKFLNPFDENHEAVFFDFLDTMDIAWG